MYEFHLMNGNNEILVSCIASHFFSAQDILLNKMIDDARSAGLKDPIGDVGKEFQLGLFEVCRGKKFSD